MNDKIQIEDSGMPSGLWGKSDNGEWHPVEYHCLDVAACAEAFLNLNPYVLSWIMRYFDTDDRDSVVRFLSAIIALHDVGKFARTFQNLDPVLCDKLGIARLADGVNAYSRAKGTAHDSIGLYLWTQWIGDESLSNILGIKDENAAILLGSAVFGHHGGPVACQEVGRVISKALPSTNMGLARRFLIESVTLIADGKPFPSLRSDVGMEPLSFVLSGLTCVADWLGSAFPFSSPDMSLKDYLKISRSRALTATSKAGLCESPPALVASFERLFPGIKPTPLQRVMTDVPLNSQFLAIIEDAPGSGKTEASLIAVARVMAAGQARGMFFGLPTTTTADAQERRQRDIYKRMFGQDASPSMTLAHGAVRRADKEDGGSSCAAWLDEGRKRMLADVCVGTVDQALLAALPARFASLRLLGLLGKVLVLDEIHSFDVYTTKLIQALLSMHAALGGSAILLSATLTANDKRSLSNAFSTAASFPRALSTHIEEPAYPLVTIIDENGSRVEKPAKAERAPPDKRVALVYSCQEAETRILRCASEGGCVLWVRNTIQAAVEGFQSLKSCYGDVVAFHAGFVAIDRARIQNSVLQRFGKNGNPSQRRGGIVVATSVVEQSLDLDFDLVVVDLKPMDSLLQALGRALRHSRDVDGTLLQDGSLDKRPPREMLVLSPDPTNCVDNSWYSSILGTASYVHGDHAVVWRTAMALHREGEVRYDSIRNLVEEAYDDSVEAPEILIQSSDRTMGKGMASAAAAKSLSGGFSPTQGYIKITPSWEDTKVPTREGDSCRLVLVEDFGNGPRPPFSQDFFDGILPVRIGKLNEGQVSRELPGLRGCFVVPVAATKDGFSHDGSVVSNFQYSSVSGILWNR